MDPALKEKIKEVKRQHRQRDRSMPLIKGNGGKMLEDIVYGANDGIITTFAVIAGVTGGSLSHSVLLILGFASLFADGISMGMSNYLGATSRKQYEKACRAQEEWEVEYIPEEERKEIEDIYRQKGLKGQALTDIVDHITADKERWVDEMMMWEFGVHPHNNESAAKSGLTTFVAFVSAGLLPLVPYLFPLGSAHYFSVSIISTAIILYAVGAARSFVTTVRWWIGGLEMLGIGALAAVAAYGIGAFLKAII